MKTIHFDQKKETIFKVNCILNKKIAKKEEKYWRSQCVIDEYLPFKSKETHQLTDWMAPSTTSTSILTFLMSHGTLLVLDPLRQTNADLKSANEVLVLIHEMVLAYCSPFLMAISCAKRLWYIKHSFPIPPVLVKAKGVNVPCSMSRTLLE